MKLDNINDKLKNFEVLHGAESEADFEFLKKHFDEEAKKCAPKYKTFKYAYFSPTDEMGGEAVEGKCHIHDWHATILHLLGLNHKELTYR